MSPCHIAILDDHQSSIDGYAFRLASNPEIKLVATGLFGEALEPMLDNHPVDVLLLDMSLPVSALNYNPYPIVQKLPLLLQKHPGLKVIVISMFSQISLVKALMKIGIKGYILKDDSHAIINLGSIVSTVNLGGQYFSQKIAASLEKGHSGSLQLLTLRQREALELCAAYPDLPSKSLAEKMSVAESTFRNLLSEAYQRLDVRTRASALSKARQLGLLPKNPNDPF